MGLFFLGGDNFTPVAKIATQNSIIGLDFYDFNTIIGLDFYDFNTIIGLDFYDFTLYLQQYQQFKNVHKKTY